MKSNGKFSKREHKAKKSLGQNFLSDNNYIEKIITELNPGSNETIVEIGPGRGALTEHLVRRAGKVIAIEIDSELAKVLREDFCEAGNFVLLEKNALEVDYDALVNLQGLTSKTKLVANLPYYISTPILQNLIKYRNSFSELVLMLQKEVVERIVAKPGETQRGFLTVMVEAYLESEKLFDVPPNAFRPVPKVMSSVVRLTRKQNAELPENCEVLFRDLVSLSFGQKRKTIKNNLKQAKGVLSEKIEKNGGVESVLSRARISITRRAEAIEMSEWVRLIQTISM